MPVTRIKNNQITDLTVNAASKLQDFSVTSAKIANNLTYDSNLTIVGNLTVQGNVTAIDTQDLVVEDPLILLAKDQTGEPSLDIGFIGKRGDELNIAFVWDESADRFVTAFTSSEVSNTVITISSFASLQVLDLDAANVTITGNTSIGNIAVNADSVIDMGNVVIGNVADPVASSDAATKAYVDSQSASGFTIEDSEGGNTVVSGGDTLDLLGTANEVTVLVTAPDTVTFGLPANVTISNNLTVTDTANVTNLNATSNVAAGNAVITNDVSANTGTFTGNVSADTFLGNIDGATGTFTGNVTADTFLGNIDGATGVFTGNVSGGNISATGDISGATLETTGNVLIGGNLIVQGNITYINIDDLRVEDPIIVLGTGPNGAPLSVNDGRDRGVYMEYFLTDLGNAFMGFQNSSGNMIIANDVEFSGNDVVQINSFGNLNVGNLFPQSLNVGSGNISSGNISVTGNVSADTFLGNIDGATGTFTGNVSSDTFLGNIDGATGTFTGNVTADTFLGNIDGATGVFTGNVSADTFLGNIDGATGVFTGNVTADTFIGNIAGNIDAGGANTAIQFNDDDILNGDANFTFDKSSGQVAISGSLVTDNVVVDGDSITSLGTELVINDTGADVNLRVEGDTQPNLLIVDAGSDTVLIGTDSATTGAALKIGTTDSILLPVGNTVQRPVTPATGMFRFNTNLDNLEFYDADGWKTAGTEFTVIVADGFNGDGSTVAFTLSEDSTTAATIVSINGVVQIPTTAYAVAGNVLTFTEAPEATDVIDARILTTTETITAIQNADGSAVLEAIDGQAAFSVTGNLLPSANVTFDLGSDTLRWRDAYFAGSSIILGNTVLKNTSGNSIGFFGPDGTTAATIDAASVDTTQIASGTSSLAVISSGGNIRANVAGNTIQTISATGADITGDFSVTGNITAQDVNSLSDAVLKTNVNSLLAPAAVINQLRGVEYDWRNGSGHSYGFLAQEVEQILPAAVKTGADGLKSINYMAIMPFLVETIKQMGAEISALKKRLD